MTDDGRDVKIEDVITKFINIGPQAFTMAEIAFLVADHVRLRGLLASMDDRNEGLRAYGIRLCPWCSWMNDGPGFTQMGMNEHSPKCPAFTPDGDVR